MVKILSYSMSYIGYDSLIIIVLKNLSLTE